MNLDLVIAAIEGYVIEKKVAGAPPNTMMDVPLTLAQWEAIVKAFRPEERAPMFALSTTQEERDEWRKKRGVGMTSAVGEYTPSEFWDLLDDVDRLVREFMNNSEGSK